MKQITFY